MATTEILTNLVMQMRYTSSSVVSLWYSGINASVSVPGGSRLLKEDGDRSCTGRSGRAKVARVFWLFRM